MTKPEIAAVALSAAACLAGVFATVAAQRSADSLALLEQRLAKLESPADSPHAAAPAGPSNADLARELTAVRSQLAALAARPSTGQANPKEKPPVGFQPPEPGAVDPKEDAEKRRVEAVERTTRWIMLSLTEKVGLTEQQGAQVRGILEKKLDEWQHVRSTTRDEDMAKAVENLLQDTNEKIKVYLTPEQQAKYDAATKGSNGVFGAGGAAATLNPPGPPEVPR